MAGSRIFAPRPRAWRKLYRPVLGVELLPDYWADLIHEDSITVHLTSIGSSNPHYLVKIENYQIHVDSENGEINVSYFICGERKDVNKILVEYSI